MLAKWIGPACAALLAWASPATAAMASQPPVDRADPSVIEQESRREPSEASAMPKPVIVAPAERDSPDLAGSIAVGAIAIDGAEALSASAFAAIVERYSGRTLGPRELRALASDVANVARGAGYGLASAWIPQQRIVNDLLRVRLDEGRIDAVEASGSGGAIVQIHLGTLADGRPVRTAALERQLLLAGDVAGIWVGRARLERRNGRNILIVDSRRSPTMARASLDNWGSSAVGPVRAQIGADFHGVVTPDDKISLSSIVTPFDPEEFRLIRLGYSKALGAGGTALNLAGYFARSESGAAARAYRGRSWEVSGGLDHALIRTRAASLWAGLELGVRDSIQARQGIRVRDDRLATATAHAKGNIKIGEGRLRGRIAVVQGIGAFDSTRGGDPLASRDDGSARFTKFEAWSHYATPLGGRFSAQLEAQGQLASRPLLSSEEIGLGGRSFLRGYDYREFSGDKGIAGSAELRFDLGGLPKAIKSAQLYVYGDAGSVGNYEAGRGGGSLASAGGGLRARVGPVDAGVELGVPLSKGYLGADRDPRFSFTLGVRF